MSGHAGASAACAQPPGRAKQDTGGGVLEGVAVSVEVAVGCADSEALEVEEGDAVEDREGGAEGVPAPAVAVPPVVFEAHMEAVGKEDRVGEGVVVGESLAGRVRVARREGEAAAVPLEEGVPTAAEGEGEALTVAEAQLDTEGLGVADTLAVSEAPRVRVPAPVALAEMQLDGEALREGVLHRVGGGDAEAQAVRDSAAVALCVPEPCDDAHAVGVPVNVAVDGLESEGEAHAVGGAVSAPEMEAHSDSKVVGEAAEEAVVAPVALCEAQPDDEAQGVWGALCEGNSETVACAVDEAAPEAITVTEPLGEAHAVTVALADAAVGREANAVAQAVISPLAVKTGVAVGGPDAQQDGEGVEDKVEEEVGVLELMAVGADD